ncbi:MAG: glycosyltransferase, partial [Pseudomonadota bacterium]|nr:glycosyltransferase [Pseudomonadota bacterium]
MPEVSVIVPIYKTEKYLRRCLDSICAQTFRDIEIICINDGSPDNSLSILDEYAIRDTRIQIINQENKGQSAARNIGLDKAQGTYIYFVDSDDMLHPQALEVMITVAQQTQA